MALVLLDRQVRPHVSVITLNKPERLNSMSFPLVEALYEALDTVGQPRDTDPRAAYILYTPDDRFVTYHRVAYDIDAAQAKIRRAGLPDLLAERLAVGR